MKNLTPSWTRITEKRGDNLKKAELNALAVRARDGSEETLLDLWNAVKGFVKKKAVYYAKNHTAGMTTAEDLVQAGFFAVYDTVQAFDETREKSFLTLLKYFLQKRFAEEAGVRTSRRDGLQYADSTAEALYSNEDSITLEDTLEDAGAAAELESVGVQRPCSLRPAGHSGRAGRQGLHHHEDRKGQAPPPALAALHHVHLAAGREPRVRLLGYADSQEVKGCNPASLKIQLNRKGE